MFYNYLKGIYRLSKIRFAIQDCEEIFFLQDTLKLFMRAENKAFQYEGRDNDFAPCLRTVIRPWIVSRLPQFSEVLHQRIKKLRAEQDAQLSKYKVIRQKRVVFPAQRPSFLFVDKETFFRHNEALLLTYPGHISGLDLELEQDEFEEQPPKLVQ